jgi:hypothetical protein
MFFYLHRTAQMKKETVYNFSFLISLAFILSETRLISLKHDHSVQPPQPSSPPQPSPEKDDHDTIAIVTIITVLTSSLSSH